MRLKSLQNGQLVDRTKESAVVANFLALPPTDQRIKLLHAPPRAGLSHFLFTSATSLRAKQIALYLDASNKVANSIFAQIIVALFNHYPSIWKEFQSFQQRKSGESAARQLSVAATSAIPYAGSGLADAVKRSLPTFTYSHFPSAVAEIVCEFLVELAERKKVAFFIDNTQELDPWSRHLLHTTVGQAYTGIRYILGLSERKENEKSPERIALEFRSLGYEVDVISFDGPDKNFVECFAAAVRLDLSKRECGIIATAAEGDVYRVRAALAEAGSNEDLSIEAGALSLIAKATLGLFVSAGQDLRKSDIIALCIRNEALYCNEDEIELNISILAAKGLVECSSLPDGDTLVKLRPSRDHLRETIGLPRAAYHKLATLLYDYFECLAHHSTRHSPAELVPLLYRLSKEVHPDRMPLHLRELIKLSLGMGSKAVAKDFVTRAISPALIPLSSQYDFVALLSFYASVNDYRAVLEQIEAQSNPAWTSLRIVRILHAIALNRLRMHEQSDSRLRELLGDASSLEERVLLVSYRIVGKVHGNDMNGACQIFRTERDALSNAKNFGYFLRNGAESVAPEESVGVLTEAIQHHQMCEDRFGLATTLCNRGAKRAQTGEPLEGLDDVKAAFEILTVYGSHHTKIVTADLGHCNMYLGNFDEAQRWLMKALKMFSGGLTRVYTLLNLAVTSMMLDDRAAASRFLDEALLHSKTARVDRIRQKAYLNGSVLKLALHDPREEVEYLCRQAETHPDRRDPNITRQVVEDVRRRLRSEQFFQRQEILKMYSPCSLLYWYQNPLEGIPLNLLSSEAVS